MAPELQTPLEEVSESISFALNQDPSFSGSGVLRGVLVMVDSAAQQWLAGICIHMRTQKRYVKFSQL